MARRSFMAIIIALTAFVTLNPLVVTSAENKPEPAKTITIAELNQMQVIGQLGQPLGKIVVIEGIVADDYYRKMRADQGYTLLRVLTVDGKKLPEEVVFHFSPAMGSAPDAPKVGSQFKYIGFESGGYTGLPTKAFDYMPRVANAGYSFTSGFLVVRDEGKAKK